MFNNVHQLQNNNLEITIIYRHKPAQNKLIYDTAIPSFLKLKLLLAISSFKIPKDTEK